MDENGGWKARQYFATFRTRIFKGSLKSLFSPKVRRLTISLVPSEVSAEIKC